MKILKFGGTSVGSAKSISALTDIVKQAQADENPVIVLSAMSGVTNSLLAMAEHARNAEGFNDALKNIEEKHFEVIRSLLPAGAQNPVLTRLKIYFNELEDILQSVYNLRELSMQTKDLILSYGERCSTFMVSHIAKQSFPNALFVDGSELIKTDSNFGQAKVNTQLTEMLIKDYYENQRENLLFVTGFISSNDEGRTTTLGRGGSDYTAAIWGASLDAEEIEIWILEDE